MDRFIKRHPEVQTKYSQRLECQRNAASNPRVLEHHFKLFQKTVRGYNIKETNIWNMDEKGFLLGVLAKYKVICKKSKKSPKYAQDGCRELITVVECVSAVGKVLPPLVMTKGADHYMRTHNRGEGGPDWVYAHSLKGWTSNTIGLEWLEYHYEPNTRPE
jgi:hypothetical protein